MTADPGKASRSDLWFNWNSYPVEAPETAPIVSGAVHDETLRDGIQSPLVRHPGVDEKLALIEHMVQSGIRSAVLGFPGAGDAAAKECRELAGYAAAHGQGLSQGFAARTESADVRAICELANATGTALSGYIFTGISPIRQYVESWAVHLILDRIRSAKMDCDRAGVDFVMVLEDTVRCSPDVLSQVFDMAVDLGVGRVVLCDTVGAALPVGTESLIRWTRRYFADRAHPVAVEWHGHNDRGFALSNSLTAAINGCDRVHGSILGVGERAGNAAIDQLMVNLHLDGHATYDLPALRAYCEYASEVLGTDIPANYPAMGDGVFTTSAGVHASAILKAHLKGDELLKNMIYSSVPAHYLGRRQEVLIDSSSGVSNVKYWLALRGRRATAGAIHQVLRAAKNIRRPLSDEEIGLIIEESA